MENEHIQKTLDLIDEMIADLMELRIKLHNNQNQRNKIQSFLDILNKRNYDEKSIC